MTAISPKGFLLVVVVVVVTCPLCTQPRPMGGKFSDLIYSFNASDHFKVNGSCHVLGMYGGTSITINGHLYKDSDKAVKLNIVAKVFKLHCANLLQIKELFEKSCNINGNLEGSNLEGYIALKAMAVLNRNFSGKNEPFKFNHTMTTYYTDKDKGKPAATADADSAAANADSPPISTDSTPAVVTTNATNTANATRKRNGDPLANPPAAVKNVTMGKTEVAIHLNETGFYLLQVYVQRPEGDTKNNKVVRADVQVKVHNPHGYLSAVDYPALVFYGLMTSVYAIYAIAWIVMMLCSFSDLVRLQFWVLAVIILGFLEKTFFVAEYSAINLGNDTYGSYIVAEFVSAMKRGLSRMLLIIVAMGFGTVKPRLGDSLFKVVIAGVAYFVLALVDGIMRSRTETFHTKDTSSVVTLAFLLLLDTLIFYWIFTSIVDTRRTLRLRKNYVKLAMYNHFAYTLIFAIIATIGFLIWVFVDLEYPSGMCLADWKEVWLRDCFWHVLFAFILLVVMVIWRPSSNRSRFAYSLVTDADDDEVLFEQGSNKNFDTLKMRSVSKPGSEPPLPVSSQAEDDLRWVEENLPTSAMDKALPLLLDSDEEVMTTKFEVSKMN